MSYYRRYRRYTNYKKKIKPKKVELTDLEKLGYGEMWEELLKKCDLTCPKCKFKNNPSYINSKDISIHTQYKYKGISLNIDKYGLYGLCTKCNNKFTFKVDIDVSKDHVVSALDEGINNFNKEISFLKKNYQEILSTREKNTHKYKKLVAPYREEETIEKNAVNKETKELYDQIEELRTTIYKFFIDKRDKSVMWGILNKMFDYDSGEGGERLVDSKDIDRFGFGSFFYIKYKNLSEFQRLSKILREKEKKYDNESSKIDQISNKYNDKLKNINFKFQQSEIKFTQQTKILKIDSNSDNLINPNKPSDLEKLENLKLKPLLKNKELRLKFLKRVFRLTNGYVYVLGNDLMPDLYKVGWTERNPEERARELSGTGVPSPYKVIFSIITKLDMKIEKDIHKKLDQYRYRKDKEFFKTDIGIIKSVITETIESKA